MNEFNDRQDARTYFKQNGWNWTFTDQFGKSERMTHWKYGASKLMIPTIRVER